jgi:hypothetical protein
MSFEVVADVQNDVYNCYYGNQSEFYGVLYIPTIKTSVMMNKLFRKIKENDNLDALEESDDDEEFENINEDKFLLQNKKYVMECEFNPKFRKWYPVRLSKNKTCLSTLNDIKSHETPSQYDRKQYSANYKGTNYKGNNYQQHKLFV